MSSEPTGESPPETPSATNPSAIARLVRRISSIAAPAFLILVVVVGVLRLFLIGAGRPLPRARAVVVLLAPDASLADWRDPAAPSLAAMLSEASASSAGGAPGGSVAIGVLPARRSWMPWRAEIGQSNLLARSPLTAVDLLHVAQQLGGSGQLGKALRSIDARSTALGDDPAARVFLGEAPFADSALSPAFSPPVFATAVPWRNEEPEAVDSFVTDPDRFAGAVASAVRSESDDAPVGRPAREHPILVVATFDDLLRCDAYAPLALTAATVAQRRAALQRLDAIIARLVGPGALPDGTDLLVVTPIASPEAATAGDALGPVLLRYGLSANATPGDADVDLLTSPSTRHTPGLLAPGDVAATTAALLGADVDSGLGAGRPASIVDVGPEAATVLTDRVAGWAAQALGARRLAVLPWLCAALLLVAALAALDGRRPETVTALGVGAAALPMGLLLFAAPPAPRSAAGEMIVIVLAALVAILLGVLASGRLNAWRGGSAALSPVPLRAICMATAGSLVLDLLLGGSLFLAHSPLSYSPVLGDRYYGIGNELSGVLIGATMLAITPLFTTRPSVIALSGVAVALALGLPTLGANAGAFVSALVAFGALAALYAGRQSGRQAGMRTGALIAGGAVLLILLYTLVNIALPASARSHVGQAASAAGRPGLKALLKRKAATEARLLVTSPYAALLLVEVGLTVFLLRRRRTAGPPDPAHFAACAAAAALVLTNDSGVTAAALCLLYPTVALLTDPPSAVPPT